MGSITPVAARICRPPLAWPRFSAYWQHRRGGRRGHQDDIGRYRCLADLRRCRLDNKRRVGGDRGTRKEVLWTYGQGLSSARSWQSRGRKRQGERIGGADLLPKLL